MNAKEFQAEIDKAAKSKAWYYLAQYQGNLVLVYKNYVFDLKGELLISMNSTVKLLEGPFFSMSELIEARDTPPIR